MSCGLCDSSTYDCEQRVVRDAAEREAVVREHVLVVLHVLAELPLRAHRRATARGARASRRGRAGRARRDSDARAGCSTRAPGAIGERHADDARLASDRGWSSRCRRPTSSARSIAVEPALERGLVQHRFVVRCPRAGGCAGRRRLGRVSKRRPVSSLRGALRDRAGRIVGASAPLVVLEPLLELEALVERVERGRVRRREREVASARTGSSQSVFTVSSRLPCGSHVERFAQVVADDAADLARVAR